MPRMRAKEFNTRVQFLRAGVNDDGFSENEQFAEHGDPVWAKKEDLSDAERFRAGELSSVITTRFSVRSSQFTRGLTPKDAMICKGREYAIYGIKTAQKSDDVLEITAGARADK